MLSLLVALYTCEYLQFDTCRVNIVNDVLVLNHCGGGGGGGGGRGVSRGFQNMGEANHAHGHYT